MRRALRLPSYISMEYKKHEDSLNDHFSYRNPSVVWRAPTTANKQGTFGNMQYSILYFVRKLKLYSSLMYFTTQYSLLIRRMCNHLNLSSLNPLVSSYFLLICQSVRLPSSCSAVSNI